MNLKKSKVDNISKKLFKKLDFVLLFLKLYFFIKKAISFSLLLLIASVILSISNKFFEVLVFASIMRLSGEVIELKTRLHEFEDAFLDSLDDTGVISKKSDSKTQKSK